MTATRTTTLTGVHPLAARWPMLPNDELAALADSISESGLQHPIVLDGQGRLIDGRNRLAACNMAAVPPTFDQRHDLTDEQQIRQFISVQNAQRRNVATGQKAMAVADDLAVQGKRRNGRWMRGSISQTSDLASDAWRVAMAQAGLVIDWRPDLTDAVISGDTTLNEAAAEAEARRDHAARRKAAEAEAEARLADLADNRPDLSELVNAGTLALDDALTIRDKALAEAKKAKDEDRLRAVKFSTTVCRSILALAPLHQFDTRRDQIRDELHFNAIGSPITATDIRDAIESLELILITHKETLA